MPAVFARPAAGLVLHIATTQTTKENITMNDQLLGLEPESPRYTIDEIQIALDELESTGIIERTGEMRWAESSREWQPLYDLTELGRALSRAGVSLSDYQETAS
jgi:hypothetical protein